MEKWSVFGVIKETFLQLSSQWIPKSNSKSEIKDPEHAVSFGI